MIVLDTNVISELMKPAPAVSLVRWMGQQATANLYTTSINQAEILHGIKLLPAGKRRSAIETAASAMFAEDFGGRILPFGTDAAEPYARIAATRRRGGHPISQFDAQIAAIALAAGADLATRNVSDFEHCGVRVVDPWAS